MHTEERLRLSGAENTGRETGGLMLSINGLHNFYYLHEKSFIKGYKFMKIERKDDVTVYKIDWKDLVTILETPIITSIRI